MAMTASRSEVSLEDQRLLAAFYFPIDWWFASRQTGEKGRKQRAGLRKAAIEKALTDPLRAAGASCSNCSERRGNVCLADSDYYGDSIIEPDGLCSWWKEA